MNLFSPDGSRSKSLIKPWLAVVACFMFMIGILLTIPAMLIRPAEKKDSLLKLFELHADTEVSGISRDFYPEFAEALSSFLAGETSSAQVTLSRGTENFTAFSNKELLHLQDVQNLFVLGHRASIAGVFMMIVTIFIMIFTLKGNAINEAFIIACLLKFALGFSIMVLLAASVLASLDFYAAFTMMHRFVFTNDLWLLNPQTDLLIQLMPEPFFAAYAKTALFRAAFFLIGSLGVTILIQKTLYKGSQKSV